MEDGEGVEIAHRLRGLCVGPGGGLSGPLAFLCSLALRKKQTYIRDIFERFLYAGLQQVIQQIPYPPHPSRHKKRDWQAKQDT